jgi:glycosyltransferase involved in cell wall biosynthesis
MRFRLNKVDKANGPGIFGFRLKSQLLKMGYTFDKKTPEYNICFSTGTPINNAINVLRLDGLYFDTKNTLGDTKLLNAPIRKAYTSFDKIIFQSKFSRDMYFTHFGKTYKPYTIISNGVPNAFLPGLEAAQYPWKKVFVCSSRWRAHKRLGAIIDGFEQFNKYYKNSGLIVLGDGDMTSSTSFSTNIKYVGKVEPHKLPVYLRGANAFIHLSWLDWCPNAVVEALACGIPVLCSHNGGTRELVRDNCIIIRLEEDYKYNKLDLYNPPEPDPKIVFDGMKKVLEKESGFERKDLSIASVAQKYIDFIRYGV